MFLLNSRLGLFTAALSGSIKINITLSEHPLSLSYGVILPSSLTRVLSRALGFSPYLPVSVYGTGTCYTRQWFFLTVWDQRLRYLISLAFTLQDMCQADLPT